MQPGDEIWTKQMVHHAAHHKPNDVWFGDPYTHALTYCPEGKYIPDSPALPKVAAFLVKHPDIAGDLWTVMDTYGNHRNCIVDVEQRVNALIAALTPDGSS